MAGFHTSEPTYSGMCSLAIQDFPVMARYGDQHKPLIVYYGVELGGTNGLQHQIEDLFDLSDLPTLHVSWGTEDIHSLWPDTILDNQNLAATLRLISSRRCQDVIVATLEGNSQRNGSRFHGATENGRWLPLAPNPDR